MNKTNQKIGRRAFLKSIGIGLAGVGAIAYKVISHQTDHIFLDPTLTPFQSLTVTPQPSPVLPTSTPTFCPGQLPNLVSKEEKAFLAMHEIQEGDTNRPVVMMTYDDNAKYDDVRAILDAYNRNYAKATFFFIGEKVRLSSKAVRAIVEEGHTLGCHGYEHIDLSELTNNQINRQIEQSFDAVNEVVPGYRMRFIRFPFGNGMGDPRLLKIAADWGLQHVWWTMGSGGLDSGTYDNVMRNVKNGSIILSHMFRPYDVSQVEQIVENLLEKGYSLESVETGRKKEDVFIT